MITAPSSNEKLIGRDGSVTSSPCSSSLHSNASGCMSSTSS